MSTAVAEAARSALAGPSSARGASLPVTLHYLGPPGTFSHQVALALVPRLRLSTSSSSSRRCDDAVTQTGSSSSRDEETKNGDHLNASGRPILDVQLKPCDTITSAWLTATDDYIDEEGAFLFLLPYENNTNGPVLETSNILDDQMGWGAIGQCHMRFIGEAFLPVSHSLLVTHDTERRLRGDKHKVELADLMKLRRVSSHEQALGQCKDFIKQHMQGDIVLQQTTSTGAAAMLLQHQGQSNGHAQAVIGTSDEIALDGLEACIASNVCAHPDVYNLVEIFADIQQDLGNMTRFLLGQAWEEDSEVTDERRIFVDPIERTSLHSRVKALYRVSTETDKPSAALLSALLAKLVNAEKLAISIKKIDRHARNWEGGKSNIRATSEGRWCSSYVIEVEVEEQRDGQEDEVGAVDARKRRKTDGHPTASQAIDIAIELRRLATSVQKSIPGIPDEDVLFLGSWMI